MLLVSLFPLFHISVRGISPSFCYVSSFEAGEAWGVSNLGESLCEVQHEVKLNLQFLLHMCMYNDKSQSFSLCSSCLCNSCGLLWSQRNVLRWKLKVDETLWQLGQFAQFFLKSESEKGNWHEDNKPTLHLCTLEPSTRPRTQPSHGPTDRQTLTRRDEAIHETGFTTMKWYDILTLFMTWKIVFYFTVSHKMQNNAGSFCNALELRVNF